MKRPTVTMGARDFEALVSLAIRGFNAEIRYKTARPKGERPSERACRRVDERDVVTKAKALLADVEVEGEV